MPLVAVDDEGLPVIPTEVEDDADVFCPSPHCQEPMYPKGGPNRQVRRHFSHYAGSGCSYEGERHLRMKAIVARELLSRFPHATVEREKKIGCRITDIRLRFPEYNERWACGIAVEVQDKNDDKPREATEWEFLASGYSVIWLEPEDFDFDGTGDVDFADDTEDPRVRTPWPSLASRPIPSTPTVEDMVGEALAKDRKKEEIKRQLESAFPSADVERDARVASCRVDILAQLDEFDPRWGRGMAVDVSFQDKPRPRGARRWDLLASGYSMMTLGERSRYRLIEKIGLSKTTGEESLGGLDIQRPWPRLAACRIDAPPRFKELVNTDTKGKVSWNLHPVMHDLRGRRQENRNGGPEIPTTVRDWFAGPSWSGLPRAVELANKRAVLAIPDQVAEWFRNLENVHMAGALRPTTKVQAECPSCGNTVDGTVTGTRQIRLWKHASGKFSKSTCTRSADEVGPGCIVDD